MCKKNQCNSNSRSKYIFITSIFGVHRICIFLFWGTWSKTTDQTILIEILPSQKYLRKNLFKQPTNVFVRDRPVCLETWFSMFSAWKKENKIIITDNIVIRRNSYQHFRLFAVHVGALKLSQGVIHDYWWLNSSIARGAFAPLKPNMLSTR